MHADWPVVALYVPISQSRQSAMLIAAGWSEYVPMGHPMHALTLVDPMLGL